MPPTLLDIAPPVRGFTSNDHQWQQGSLDSEIVNHVVSTKFHFIAGALRKKCPLKKRLGIVVFGENADVHLGPCAPNREFRASLVQPTAWAKAVNGSSREELSRLGEPHQPHTYFFSH